MPLSPQSPRARGSYLLSSPAGVARALPNSRGFPRLILSVRANCSARARALERAAARPVVPPREARGSDQRAPAIGEALRARETCFDALPNGLRLAETTFEACCLSLPQ